jgi:hypothetical protein
MTAAIAVGLPISESLCCTHWLAAGRPVPPQPSEPEIPDAPLSFVPPPSWRLYLIELRNFLHS